MTRCVALLRAVNVGGRKPVAMADLRRLASDLGFAEPQTLLQSGNLVFTCGDGELPHAERRLEREAAERLGLTTEVFLRTAADLDRVIARNPFPEQAAGDPARLHVVFLRRAPDRAGVESLRAAITGREVVAYGGRELYAVYPEGAGRSRLTLPLIERRLGAHGTARNWNTVLRLAAAVRS
ncbi:MAG TPA: DUF1697 domain-containing protein [Thermoanaerobaculaceae bacterium]|nr:DUF1697 domain-containing protein [Thermoanaerobaculaceae bacterium]